MDIVTNRKKDMDIAKKHFLSIGLNGGDLNFVMERLITTWRWIDNENKNTEAL